MSAPAATIPRLPRGAPDPDQLPQLLGIPFTDEQMVAITAPLEPGVVVAGAGSGKTSVMAARVVWLVASGQVAPEEVLGLTFTNKAAGELAERIRRALARAGLAGAGLDGEPTVATYHAYAGRLVAEHGLRLGVEPRARLLADASRFQLARAAVCRYPGPVEALTKTMYSVVEAVIRLDGELAEHLVEPAALRAYDEDLLGRLGASGVLRGKARELACTARERLELTSLVEAYQAAKHARDAVDFGDQVRLGARLAEQRPEVGEIERARFRVVLLDEYQDTSVAQRRLLAGLFGDGHPVTAVGDPCQAIYGWRGASVSNLDSFPDHFRRVGGDPAARFPLTVNQRSGGRLLHLANAVAAPLREVHAIAELRPRPDVTTAGHTACALHLTYAEEMAWLAERIRAAVDEGTPPGEVAVLVRARADFPAVHQALVDRDLPVEVVGLGGLLSLPEVADLVATLRVLDEPTSNAALVRLLSGPRWRLGPRDLVALGRRARELVGRGGRDRETGALEQAVSGVDPTEVVALADALADPGRRGWSADGLERATAFAAEIRELREHLGEPLLDLLHRILAATGLEVELAASPEALAARRREALATFLDVAAGFTDLDGNTSVSAFLAFLDAAAEHERGLDTMSPSGGDAVAVLTVHKAKGLEWDVVAVPDLTRDVFPQTRSRDRWTSTEAVLPTALRGDADGLPELGALTPQGFSAYEADCRAHQEREERRLGYVAFTRARTLLLASGHWWGPTQKKRRGPSPFLIELREHCESGYGEVERWAPEPPEPENPFLDALRHGELAWPAPLEPVALARRRTAAAQVRELLAAAGPDVPSRDGFIDDGLTDDERERAQGWDDDAAVLLAEAAAAATPAERVVPLPRSLSASALIRLSADPDGLARDLARPMPRPPSARARRGTRFHAWVESMFAQRPLLDPEDVPGAGDAGQDGDGDLAALRAAFLAGPYGALAPLALEAPFELVLGGRTVRGRIDAVYETADGFEVVDWKTGEEDADPVQLAVYRLAWAKLRAVPPDRVTAAFYYVRSGRVERPHLASEGQLAALLTGRAHAEQQALW